MLYRKERKVAAALRSLMSQTRDTMVCFEFATPIDPSDPQDVIDAQLRDAHVIEASTSFARYFGHEDREAVLGQHLMDLFHHEIPEWFVHYGQEVEDRNFENLERRVEIPVGDSVRPMRVYMQNIFEGDLLTSQWITITDVSEQEEQARVIAENEQLERLAFDAVGLQTFVLSDASSTTGEGLVATILETGSYEAIHSDDVDALTEAADLFCSGASPGLHHLFRSVSQNRTIWLETWATSSSDGAIIGVLMDRTNSKRMEEAIFATERLESLGVLAGGIAHDFNNLLVSILGSLDLISLRIPEARQELEVIDEAASQAADLCDQLLTYAGRGTGNLDSIDVGEALDSMRELLAVSIHKDADLFVSAEPNCWIKGDASQLRQVALNLVKNSSDSMNGTPGEIRVTVALEDYADSWRSEFRLSENLHDGPYVTLRVRDSGCGMSAEEIDRAFDPFFTTKFTGRGLGLAVVVGIVRGHNGAIKVSSQPGTGTEFVVVWPHARPEGQSAADGHAEGDELLSGRVLVVDDEPRVLETATQLLSQLGLDVIAADSGSEALRLVDEEAASIDTVLMDVTMPELDGVETASRILAAHPEMNVVLCSGYSNVALPDRLGESVGFLQKPFRLGELRAALEPFFAPA